MGRIVRPPSSLATLLPSLLVISTLTAVSLGRVDLPAQAAPVAPTVVTIEWHDGNADQADVPPILETYGMNATFLVNTGPILAGNPDKMSVADLLTIYTDGNEIAGHTLDHVNIQPLSSADARLQVCTDRNNLLEMGFQPTTFAYPFASFDAGSEDVVHYCNYNDASATAGLSLRGTPANTIPPADPYAIRTVPAIKKSTKLATMERYVANAETFAQANGSAWVIFVFHHLCDAHCGPYVISAVKFGAFLAYLQAQSSNGVVVKTVTRVMGGGVKGRCDPVTGAGCDTTPR